MSTRRELPMFPLGTVLFPGMPLPLHVFEPRYRALTGWCLERDVPFGVVLIERGFEVGGGDSRFAVGTTARIVRSQALADGRWVLLAQGEQRFRVERWLGEEPFPRAEVSLLDDADRGDELPPGARDALVGRFERIVGLLRDLGEWPGEGGGPPVLADDPCALAWQLGASGLFGPADAQRLLETGGVAARLAVVASLLDEQIEVLALRAAGG